MCNNEIGDFEIESESECREAGELLGLSWAGSWDGSNDFPACLYADDARKKVYFNRSPYPGRTKAYPAYSAICTKDTDGKNNHI